MASPDSFAVCGFSMITMPPAAFTSRAPSAPSVPVPVKITAMSRSPYIRAALLSSRLTSEGLERRAVSLSRRRT